MTPPQMREWMRKLNATSSDLHFKNKDGETVFAAFYVEGKGACKLAVGAMKKLADEQEQEIRETTLKQ